MADALSHPVTDPSLAEMRRMSNVAGSMLKRVLFGGLSILVCATVSGANWPERPTLRAVRVAAGPAIDGDLSDAAWQNAPEFTDFTQHDPDDGQAPTMRTSIRIVYDDDAIYFGAKMDDPSAPTALLV